MTFCHKTAKKRVVCIPLWVHLFALTLQASWIPVALKRVAKFCPLILQLFYIFMCNKED